MAQQMTVETLEQLKDNNDFHKFIGTNINADTNQLRLKTYRNMNFDVSFAILQIDCKKRIKKKLPEIYAYQDFLFPNILSTEQCTAEIIAKFHASLLDRNDSVLDLTAGLCIDAYYISKKVKNVTAIELNPETAKAAQYNMNNFAKNVTVLNMDCADFLRLNENSHYDRIFIDPARRGDNNKRLFGLNDCNPNIIELIPILHNISNTLYIKASPMLDISQAVNDLNNYVTDIWIIGINNECKEILFKVDLSQSTEYQPNIHTVNFENGETQELSCSSKNENIKQNPSFATPCVEHFIYEPNSCIMKAQLFGALQNQYGLSPIHSNSHLFVSNKYIPNFPGRKFLITEIIPFKSKEIKELNKKHPQINVSVRNFKLSAEELKKKLKVNDGGNEYLFGTTDKNNNAILIICQKAFQN